MPIAPKGHFPSQNALCDLSYSCYRFRHLRHFYFCRVGSDYTVPGRDSKGSDIDRSSLVSFNARISMSEKCLELEKKKARMTLSTRVALRQHFPRRIQDNSISSENHDREFSDGSSTSVLS